MAPLIYRTLAALTAVTSVAICGAVAAQERCVEYEEPEKIGKVGTDKLQEISGLVVSRHNPEVLWVHNDSGGDNRIYAIATDGEYLGRWELEGVGADDFEDIAYGPCADGMWACLYIGDFGNNEGRREKFQIYRVREPVFDLEEARDDRIKEEIDKDDVEKILFRYPTVDDDETPDAEAMMIDARGVIYVFTKWREGTELYTMTVPDDLDDRVTLSKRSARYDLFRVTGADLADSGDRFVVRNLDEAREFVVAPGQDIGAAFRGDYVRFSVGHEKQGEAIGYELDGLAILTTSERKEEPIYRYECLAWEDLGFPEAGKADQHPGQPRHGQEQGQDTGGCATLASAKTSPISVPVLVGLVALAGAFFRRRRV